MRTNIRAALWSGLVVASLNACNCDRVNPGVSPDDHDAGTTVGGTSSGTVGPNPILPPVGIARIEPNRGPTTGGTVLVMTGYNFTPTLRVKFGDAEATDITVTSSQTVSLTTPPGAEGVADVVVTNSDGATTRFSSGFRYVTLADDAPPAPSLDSVSPNTGPSSGGTVAFLEGDGFQRGVLVIVGGRPARRVYWLSDTEITAVFPEGQVGTAKVAVTNPDGRSDLLVGAFAYYDVATAGPAPQLTSVMPSDGPVSGGQDTAAVGSAFDAAVRAYLGGRPLTLTGVTDSAFNFVAPPGPRGLAPLMVTNPDGQSAILEGAYNYFSPPPIAASVSPSFAARAGGVPITIGGRWFQTGATVTIGAAALENVAVASAESITGVVPEGTTGGPVDVTVTNPDGLASTLPGGFYYVDAQNPAPGTETRLVRLAPAVGPTTGGTTVSAFGAGFLDGITVKVGGALATDVRRLGAATIAFRVPAGSAGPADVEVQNPGEDPVILRRGFVYFDASSSGPSPTIRSVMPRASPVAGGGTVAIFGTDFDPAARVYFGANESDSVRVSASSALSARVPAGSAGQVDVIVVNPDGNSGRFAGGFAYFEGTSPDPAPTLEFVAPDRGSATTPTTVSIAGTGFAADAVVFVDGIFVDSVRANDRQLQAIFPPHAAGIVDVTITNPDGQSATLTGAFTYEAAPPPMVTSVSPSTGSAVDVTTVTITGSGFVAGTTVNVGGESVPVVIVDGTTMTATIPPQPEGPVAITVTNPDGQNTTVNGQFTSVAAPAPTLTAVAPSTGFIDASTTVQLTGTGFSSLAIVRVDGVDAESTTVSATTISATFPAHAAGAVDVMVVHPDGKFATLAGAFTYSGTATPMPAPVVTGISPNTGSAADVTRVTITGSGFVDGTKVLVGGVEVPVTRADGTTLTATIPPQPPGPVNVTVTNPDGQSTTVTGGFTSTAALAPTIAGLAPTLGAPDATTTVLITGTGFSSLAIVRVDGIVVAATVVNGTTLTAQFPPHAAATVSVTLTNPDGQVAALVGGFTYGTSGGSSSSSGGSTLPARVITDLEPWSGPAAGGTRVAVRGRGMIGVAGVRFGSAVATDVQSLGTTVVQVTSPAGAPGPVDVEVALSDGTAIQQTNAFFYVAANAGPSPTVSSIFPTQGPQTGGTPIIVRGTRFYAGTRLFIGGLEATGLKRVDDNTLTAVVPAAQYPGTVPVTVVRTDGSNARASGGFTYYEPGTVTSPTLTSVSPPTASTLGGSAVTANGSELRDGLAVLVDGFPASDVVRGSASRVTFAAPPHSAGAATVSVVNPDGTFASLSGGLVYQAQPPVLTDIAPTEGPRVGLTGVTVRGAGFDPAIDVLFNGVPSSDVRVLSPGLLLALTPAGQVGPVDVTVVNPDGGSATLSGAFSYFDGYYSDQAPRLDAVNPPRAVTTGGTMISIRGANLRAGGRLLFGQEPAAELVVISDTEVTAITPPMSPQSVDLVWVGPDGQVAVIRGGFTFSDAVGPPPQIGGASPNRGPETGGTPVIIAGASFVTGAIVFFDRASGSNTAVLNSAFVSTRTPVHLPGTVSVTVTNPDGVSTTRPSAFTFVASPQILGVSPAVGRQGTTTGVTIAGRNFSPTATVSFGTVQATGVSVGGDSLITATAPALPAGAVDLIVQNDDGQRAILPGGFEYLTTPALTEVQPPAAPATAGTRTILIGDGFRSGLRVYVGGVEATDIVFVNERTVTIHLPAGTLGDADVRVVNPDGQEVTLTGGITRVDPGTLGAPPTLSACLPDKGRLAGATAVRLSGASFIPNAFSFFAGRPAQTGFVDTATLSTRTPPGEAGPVLVEVTNPDGQTAGRAGCFTYTDVLGTDPPPLVSLVQPNEGPTLGGADAVVSGDNFRTGAVVLFGNRLASSINVVSATRIEARTPPGDVGPADVTVSNSDGTTGTLPGGYRYLAPPVVTVVNPPEGPSVGGTTITITGQNFLVGAQVRVGGNLCTGTTVVSDQVITAVTPAGTPGVVDVTVVNSDGQVGQLPGGFAYTAPPTVLGVIPASGTSLGGEFVTVNGSGFRANARATFGGVDATQVSVLSGSAIRARTPAHSPGAVEVTVTNVDGFSDTLAAAFTFVAPPNVAAVSPSSGPDTGGTTVTIVGTGFQNNAAVLFGATPAASVTFINPTVLEVVTPARPAGPAAVTVRNPDGQEHTLASAFYYFPPVPPPRITAISPNFGPITGGTICTVTGDDFQYGAEVFVGPTQVLPTDVAVLAQTQMRIRIPASSTVGAADVRVLNPDGQTMTLDDGFTYMPALALPPLGLSSVSPNRMTTAGDILSTVLGNGMATDVRFEVVKGTTRVPVTIERYFSDVAVQVRMPAVSEEGLYDLVATLPSTGATASLLQRVEYKNSNVFFTMNRGRLPNDSRTQDEYAFSADFSGDGFNDVMILRGIRQSVIYQNRGAAQPGHFDDVTGTALVGEPDNRTWFSSHWSPVVADFTLDGYLDVVAGTNMGSPYDGRWLRMWTSLGFGRMQFGPVLTLTTTAPGGWGYSQGTVVGDIDNADGPDILVCTRVEDYWFQNRGVLRDGSGDPVLDGNGRTQWLGFLRHPFRAIINGVDSLPTEDTRGCDVGDLDLDGDLDVVFGNAGNQASRLYINDIATTGATLKETLIDEFTAGEAWGENQMTGSATGGVYRLVITNTSDPWTAKGVTAFDARQNNFQMRYRSSVGNGPQSVRLYYTDSGVSCGGWTDTCAETFGLVRDGNYQTLSVNVSDAEWMDLQGAINNIRLDFDGGAVNGTVEIDWIKFGGTYRMPQFIDASGSAMFNYAADVRSMKMIDIENDGDLDILSLNWDQDNYVLVNTVDGLGNRLFQNQPGRFCHDAACSLSSSNPPLRNRGIYLSVGADYAARFGGTPTNPTDKWLDINRDGCTDLAVFWENGDGVPRYYINRKVGSGPASCTGEFYYKQPSDPDPTNPIRNLYQVSLNPTEQKTLFGRGIDSTPTTRDHWFHMSDFDGDGWLDLFQVPFPYSTVTGQQKRIYIRKPVVEGTETYMRFFDETTHGELPRSMARCHKAAATDINGDGYPDLIMKPAGVCSETAEQIRTRIYLNDGAGNFADASDRLPVTPGYAADLAVADLNGDGLDDILLLQRQAGCGPSWDVYNRLFQNDGTGYFVDVTSTANLGQGQCADTTDSRYWLNSVTPVDVDNDGDLDLVYPGNQYCLRRLSINGGDPLGVGSPYFIDRSSSLPGFTGNRFVAIDYNADGKTDLYLARDNNNWPSDAQDKLFENDGAGNFADVTLQSFNQAASNSRTAVVAPFVAVRQPDGSLLGKPYPDIFAVTSNAQNTTGEQRRIHVSALDTVNNEVRFSDLSNSNMRPGSDGRFSHTGKGFDLDRDGRMDVMMNAYQDRPLLYYNLGSAVFEDRSATTFPEHYNEASQDIVVADFDQDGDDDVFQCNYFQQNRIYWNREIP